MVPKISISKNLKLKVECKCKESSNKEISIREFKKYLVDKKSFNKDNFKCENHKKNFCFIVRNAKKISVFIAKEK